jgi:uncharacterized membrane protein YfcA
MTHFVLVAAFGLVAGVLSGLFGVGGGIVFVPALTLGIGLHQLPAEATSLAAIVPVAAVGAWRQQKVDLVRWRQAAIVGSISVIGVLGGAQLATSLPDATLRRAFGVFLVVVAGQMAWKARKPIVKVPA